MKELDVVSLKEDFLGLLPAGAQGTIVHVYEDDTFEVEFPREDKVPIIATLSAGELNEI